MATSATGLINTYDLTAGVIVDIDPAIRNLSPTDTPLYNGYGADGRTTLARGTMFEKKKEWQDTTILTPRSAPGAALSSTTGTVLTVTSGDRLNFSTGDVLLINTEQVRVTGYGSTADTLLISRGYGGTTAATAATTDVIINLGAHLTEGSDPEDPRSRDWDNRYNLSQIFGPTAIKVSGTEQAIRKYGLEGTTMFDFQAANRAKEEVMKLENALLYGSRYDDTTNETRQMGGMINYITTNVDSSTTTFAGTTGETALLNLLEDIWNAGGNPDKAIMSIGNKRKVSAWSESEIRIGRMDNGRGQVVDVFFSDFGTIDMIAHRWMRTGDIFVFSRDQAELLTLRPWQFEMLAKTGDSIKGQIVGEYSLKFEADRWAGRFSALT